jgi:hypothetical protein
VTGAPAEARLDAEYVLPLAADAVDGGLVDYLASLVRVIDVTVVDGSPEPARAALAAALPAGVRHLAPEAWPGANRKVAGVMTGVRAARHDRVVLADDDVRYDRQGLAIVVGLLDSAEVVRPQNVFDPLPWHARWDTARSLINRAFGSDYPGTLGIRAGALLAAGGYDGDTLFENLELIRTLQAHGAQEARADALGVRRMPPTARHFLGQRVRQAYDDFAQPPRLVAELLLAPLLLAAARRPVGLVALLGASVALAEVGRRRCGGRSLFPATAALWAPAWMLERAVCVWVALLHRLAGGMPYRGSRLRLAAHPVRDLVRRSAYA